MTTQSAEASAGVPSDSFPLRLSIARFAAGHLTAEKAGALVGVTGTTWLNWERGKHLGSATKPAMLSYIARQLDCDEHWLREGGPLNASTDPSGGERARQDSNLRPADYPVADLAAARTRFGWRGGERRSRPRQRQLVTPVQAILVPIRAVA
jgi:hypothetical protein